MSKQANSLSGRIGLVVFIDFVQDYTAAISDSKDRLQAVHALFLSGQLITPPEFENAIKCIHNIGEYCRKFHAFIEESINLPLVVIPLRLPLLIALKDVGLQVSRLKRLFSALQEVLWTTHDQPIEQRLLIQQELEELQLGCEEVLDQVNSLLNDLRYEKDRSRFEKRINNVI